MHCLTRSVRQGQEDGLWREGGALRAIVPEHAYWGFDGGIPCHHILRMLCTFSLDLTLESELSIAQLRVPFLGWPAVLSTFVLWAFVLMTGALLTRVCQRSTPTKMEVIVEELPTFAGHRESGPSSFPGLLSWGR
jgi:hypothetical protein